MSIRSLSHRVDTDGSVSKVRQNELREALEDSPIVICFNLFIRQLLGWPFYLAINASGQRHYPPGTNRE